jgi:hypothetical protein
MLFGFDGVASDEFALGTAVEAGRSLRCDSSDVGRWVPDKSSISTSDLSWFGFVEHTVVYHRGCCVVLCTRKISFSIRRAVATTPATAFGVSRVEKRRYLSGHVRGPQTPVHCSMMAYDEHLHANSSGHCHALCHMRHPTSERTVYNGYQRHVDSKVSRDMKSEITFRLFNNLSGKKACSVRRRCVSALIWLRNLTGD